MTRSRQRQRSGTTLEPPLVILLTGVSGCGKTTTGKNLSKVLGWPYRDADEFHPAANVAKMRSGTPLTDNDRWPWLDAIGGWIDERRRDRAPAIVSCSALKHAYRSRLLAGRDGVRLVYLQGRRETIAERLAGRKGHFMPAALLESQFATLEEPRPDEGALVVPIALSPRKVVHRILSELELSGSSRA